MGTLVLVFWLMIDAGGTRDTPVFLPEPFSTIDDCTRAGEVFKASTMDRFEAGLYVCLPQTKE